MTEDFSPYIDLKEGLRDLLSSILKTFNLKNMKYSEFIYNFHSQCVQRTLGYLHCYKDFVDSEFNIEKIGVPIACDIEVQLVNSVLLSFYEGRFR